MQRLLSPATNRPAFAPVGDQSFVRLRFIDRPNSTTAVQSSRSPLSSSSFGPRRVSAFRQCGEVVLTSPDTAQPWPDVPKVSRPQLPADT